MVSLLPTIDGRLFHIKGGNRHLAERLLNATGANLLLGMKVTAVHKGAQGGFQVHARRVDAPKEVKTGLKAYLAASGDDPAPRQLAMSEPRTDMLQAQRRYNMVRQISGKQW